VISQPIDKPKDHCGVFGVFGHPQAAKITYFGLMALQHRGQEGSGIVTTFSVPPQGKPKFNAHRGFGLVSDVYRNESLFDTVLKGDVAIGHNRYSTSGSADNPANIQPLTVNYRRGNVGIAHNGNLTNFRSIRRKLQDTGTIFQTTSDTEVILHLIARSKEEEQIRQILEALNLVEGAFSLAILTDTMLVAARDPLGVRPLAVGRLGDAFLVASETCAFDIVDAKYVCDVNPGEVLVFDRESLRTGEARSFRLEAQGVTPRHCIFEYVYFSRPDSTIFNDSVDKVRRKLGKALAKEHPPVRDEGDEKVVVINVPDSSNTATLGYVSESVKLGYRTKYEIGLIRSHYVGRTFIQPAQGMRQSKVRTKFNTVRGVLRDKVVVIVDDSIVRGTTSKQLVKLIRDAGAREIHFRVTSPPVRFPCHYGMDFPSSEELIANVSGGDIGKIRDELGVDSLGYLSLEQLEASVPRDKGQEYCTACFSGRYPTAIEENGSKNENDA
jgi:amidophosphoribosyltransferase